MTRCIVQNKQFFIQKNLLNKHFFSSFHEQTFFSHQIAEQIIFFPFFCEQSFFHKKTIAPPQESNGPPPSLWQRAFRENITDTSHCTGNHLHMYFYIYTLIALPLEIDCIVLLRGFGI